MQICSNMYVEIRFSLHNLILTWHLIVLLTQIINNILSKSWSRGKHELNVELYIPHGNTSSESVLYLLYHYGLLQIIHAFLEKNWYSS